MTNSHDYGGGPYSLEYGQRCDAPSIRATDLEFCEHQSEADDGWMHIALRDMSRRLLEGKVGKYA
jgi:hypothetical protein